MSATPLDYSPPDSTKPRRRRLWLGLGIVVAILVLAPAAGLVKVGHTGIDIDAITGTARSTSTFFGFPAGTRFNVSPLETRLTNSKIAWTPSWRPLSRSDRNIYGGFISHGCSLAPPIYSPHPVASDFARTSSDQALRDFVQVMQSGTDDEQERAISAAVVKTLSSMEIE